MTYWRRRRFSVSSRMRRENRDGSVSSSLPQKGDHRRFTTIPVHPRVIPDRVFGRHTDDIVEVARFDRRFIERGSKSSDRQIGIGMSWARRLVTFLKFAANVSRSDPEPIRQPGSSTLNVNAQARVRSANPRSRPAARPGGAHPENPRFSPIVPEP